MTQVLPPALVDAIRSRLGVRARPGESLARHTSFRIGGPADLLVVPDTVDELAHVLRTAAADGVRVALLGGGSNMLIGDGGTPSARAPPFTSGESPAPPCRAGSRGSSTPRVFPVRSAERSS